MKYPLKNIIIYGIGGRIKRFCFTVFELLFPKLEIDKVLIEKTIKEYHLDAITSQLQEEYKKLSFAKTDKMFFFGNIVDFVGRSQFLKDNPFFLYPPNVAVIDFLLKNANKDSVVVDYGSGLGNLLIYLRKIGYNNTFGYDDFSQIRPETTESFLKQFGLSGIIMPKDEILSYKNSIATCICYYWSQLDKDILKKEMENPNLEYILLDYHYAPRYIKNFKIVGIYKNLLIVFKRK